MLSSTCVWPRLTTPFGFRSIIAWIFLQIQAWSHLGSFSEVSKSPLRCAKTFPFRVKEWLSFLCRFPRTTPRGVGATVRTLAFVCAATIQVATVPAMRLCCLRRCHAVSAILVAILCVRTTRPFVSQWVFGPKAVGRLQPLCSGTAPALQQRHRCPGWPGFSLGCSVRRTCTIGRPKSFRGGRRILFASQELRSSPELTWICMSSCFLAAGAQLPLFATCKRRPLPTPPVPRLLSPTGLPCSHMHALHRQGPPLWLSCRPLWIRFGRWLLIAFVVRGYL